MSANEGAEGDTFIILDCGLNNEELASWEWIEQGKGYREFLIPADVVNRYSRRLISADDIEEGMQGL